MLVKWVAVLLIACETMTILGHVDTVIRSESVPDALNNTHSDNQHDLNHTSELEDTNAEKENTEFIYKFKLWS